MRTHLIVALTLLGCAPAWAAEPSGCDKFKWPIERERAALTAPDRPKLASGADITAPAITLGLVAPSAANLPTPPERAPKPGVYTISLSSAAWVDVVQDGKILKPQAFSGALDCDGIRKTMKYDLAASPFVIQISGATDSAISLAVLPANQ